MPMATTPFATASDARHRTGLVAMLAVLATLAMLGILSPIAVLIVLRDGWAAAAVVLAAVGYGLWLVRAIGLHQEPRCRQVLFAVGLGLGGLALLVLAAGVLGLLQQWLWTSVVIGGMAVGLWRVRTLLSTPPGKNARVAAVGTGANALHQDARLRWLWLTVAGFAALGLLASTMPPGVLWPEEGNGYDVLEYHLGVPREYFEAGRIAYLPHNIYSNFPFNVEMLYLLTMVLRGGPIEAVFTAQLLNVLLGGLAVAAIWLAGREFGRAAGLVAGVAAGSCPFIPYLCGVAYVENGMILFAALALAAAVRLTRISGDARLRWALVGGLLAGLACGCKYTAAPMVFAPLSCAVLMALWCSRGEGQKPSRAAGLHALAVFFVGWAVTFGPWLAKNAVWTGNPVFPLARAVLPERAGRWADEPAARWHEGHLPAPEDRPWSRRIARLWGEVIGSRWFGALPGLAILGGVVLAVRRRGSWKPIPPDPPDGTDASTAGSLRPALLPCWLMLLFGIVTWLAWTHLVWRFAVVLVVPAAVVVGAAVQQFLSARMRSGTIAALLVGATANLGLTVTTFREGLAFRVAAVREEQRTDGRAWFTEGQWPWQAHVPGLNALAREGRRVLMVGDARRFYLDQGIDYCVVFNRNPFAEAAADLPPSALMQWLRDRGYAALYVDWGELRRLRGSRYGFWESIDESLFAGLEQAGLLRRLEDFTIEPDRPPYGTLYRVPQ